MASPPKAPTVGYVVNFPGEFGRADTVNRSTAATAGIVIVEIGPDAKKFYVHKALLMHHSEYFKKALSGTWKEAQEGIVRLHDVEVEACELDQGLEESEVYTDQAYSRSLRPLALHQEAFCIRWTRP